MCLAALRKTGTPCQSSSLLTWMRTLSWRQIRQLGSLRSMSNLTGLAALVIVLVRKLVVAQRLHAKCSATAEASSLGRT